MYKLDLQDLTLLIDLLTTYNGYCISYSLGITEFDMQIQ